MTCQELLAFSVAFSAALPTGQSTLESFYSSLARCDPHTVEALKRATAAAAAAASGAASDAADAAAATVAVSEMANAPQTASITSLELAAVSAAVPMSQHADAQQRSGHTARKETQRNHYNNNNNNNNQSRNNNGHRSNALQPHRGAHAAAPATGNYMEDYACCYDLYQNALSPLDERRRPRSPALRLLIAIYRCLMRVCSWIRRYIKRLVEHKYFQQGILLAILINTLSMGIEYHDQPEELTAIVETSNVVFSGIFAVEMLLKVIAEGPFRYIANGFNVFDGIIVILRYA